MADEVDYDSPWSTSGRSTRRRRGRNRARNRGDDHPKPPKRRRWSPEPKPDNNPLEELKVLRRLELAVDPPTGIAHPPLRIAAFNIRTFGRKKMRKTDISRTLVKIIQRYDLILLQEIRDRSETALDKLVEQCSSVDPDDPFTSIVSERLGRTHSKEQYAFMYRYKKLKLKDIYQYDDGEDNGNDVFQREPFAVLFTCPSTVIQDFAVIAIHTDPDDAVREIGALDKVYDVTKARWNLADILIAGDFNADEGYVNRDDWAKIALRNDRRFKWMIKDETDTTVGNTDRAYDRFVVAGKKLMKAIVPESTRVFKFDDEFGLTNDEAEEISDHYPIEMKLTGKANLKVQDKVQTSVSFTVHQKQPIAKERSIRQIYKTESGSAKSAYFTHNVNFDDSEMQEVVAKRSGIEDVSSALKQFQKAFPGVIMDETLEMVKAFLNSSMMTQKQNVYGLLGRGHEDRNDFEVIITASLIDPMECQIKVVKQMS